MAIGRDEQDGTQDGSGTGAAATAGSAIDGILAGCVFLLVCYVIVSAVLGTLVEASAHIGKVVNVTGGGGLAVKLLVQTESGFYPLKRSVVIEPGTPLILERRQNGDVYVCGPNHDCVETAQSSWKEPGSTGAR